jgi:hypothetical protein
MKIALITPVGPNHKEIYQECLKSINDAWNYSHGPFSNIEIIAMWDLEGKYGRSARRNAGINLAIKRKCEWLFFIDADDLMSQFAFNEITEYIEKYDAIWGGILEANINDKHSLKIRENQLIFTEDISDILNYDPYLTLQMGHFVKTSCLSEIRFDITMNTGEDFKYYLEIWSKYKCAKVEKIFFLNRRGCHSQGPKSANGKDWRDAVQKQIDQMLAFR